MERAQRLKRLPPYLFAALSQKIAELRAKGVDVISLGIGDPDPPTPAPVLERLWEAAQDPANHRYPETEGLPRFREAVAEWYRERFGVVLDPAREVLSLIGSKEGIGHMGLCYLNPGDVALVPDPAYPVYAIGTLFAGAQAYSMPLREERAYLPELEAIPPQVAHRAKLLWLNYPNNPTAAVADLDFFERAVAYCRRYDIGLCHDNAYSDVTYDGYRAPSLLEVPGAKEMGVEFHSLSKTYNMTGWRIGMAVGNAAMVGALAQLKANLDSGVPQAIQEAAIAALRGPQGVVAQRNALFQRRRDRAVAALRGLGLRVQIPKASFYLWAGLPPGQSSGDYAARVLDATGVVVTPGVGFGQYGEGYIRISLTVPDQRLEEALARLTDWSAGSLGTP